MMRFNTRQLFVLILCLAGLLLPAALQAQYIDLSGPGHSWRVMSGDNPTYAQNELDDRDWQTVQLPENLMNAEGLSLRPNDVIWLRTTVRLQQSNRNIALILGKVADYERTYFNGVLIGKTVNTNDVASHYNLARIYPIPSRLIRSGENVIAIRITGSFAGTRGIVQGPIELSTIQNVEDRFWRKQRTLLIFTAVYFATGIFFLILYRRLRNLNDYKWFGIFAITFAIQQFMINEIRFQIADWFLFFKLIEHLCYLAIPVVYFFFFIHFFKVERIKYISFTPKKIGNIYALLNMAVGISYIFLMDPVRWDRILTLWFFVHIPFFVFYVGYSMWRAATTLERDAIIVSIGTFVMLLITGHYYMVERGVIAGPAYFSQGVFIFFLTLSFALIFRLIELQMEVEERTRRLDSVNVLRDRVFQYVNIFLRKPSEKVAELSHEVFFNESSSPDRALVRELDNEVEQLQVNIDDILELSRLEVITEPEYVEQVNFRDFINAVIPRGVITHYIKVNPNIVLNTSLELVNSFVIRLIDFPAFHEFRHIDLIITSDLNGHVHFRFMLFHNNVRKTRQLYELLTEMESERGGGIWVKWAIIREIIRILRGTLDIGIINRKFLRIDIELEAELPRAFADVGGKDYIKIEYQSEATSAGGENETESVPAAPVATSRPELPRLHAKMTVGEFVNYVRARVARNRDRSP